MEYIKYIAEISVEKKQALPYKRTLRRMADDILNLWVNWWAKIKPANLYFP
jgi:hypothetical protein